MHGFSYRDGSLHCEGVSLDTLAEKYGTPLYVYSAGTIRDHYRRLDAAMAGLDHEIAYAVKANSNLSVLRLLAEEGAGFDIVSTGELFRAMDTDIEAREAAGLPRWADAFPYVNGGLFTGSSE
jgi:diaminopimelate decarboxylase